MNKKVVAIDPDELSHQLRCPSGDHATEMADNMFVSNANMINETIEQLQLRDDAYILEIGFANGKHLEQLIKKANNIDYQGIDISKAMVTDAQTNNAQLMTEQKIRFTHVVEDNSLPFAPESFDICFTVNTLYFWQQPQDYLQQIYALMKQGGQCVISFIDKKFAEKLPLNQDIFQLYEVDEVVRLLQQAGFTNIHTHSFTEEVWSKFGGTALRPCSIVSAVKT